MRGPISGMRERPFKLETSQFRLEISGVFFLGAAHAWGAWAMTKGTQSFVHEDIQNLSSLSRVCLEATPKQTCF